MAKFDSEISIFSPAKINLHLAVKEKRPDGFHNLESVFLALDWGDRLCVRGAAEDGLQIAVPSIKMSVPEGVTGEDLFITDNIIWRALALFREKTSFLQNFDIKLEKNIPIGGGLGGGSSNAASALLAFNQIAGFPLKKDELLEMGAALGSDVPFFLHNINAAWVTGRGEYIKPLGTDILRSVPEMPKLYLVLVYPGFSSNTATAYRLLDEYRIFNPHENIKETIENACSFNVLSRPETWEFSNDFLNIFPENEKSVYQEIIANLKESGALFASLSGAGSVCFGVFENEEHARKTVELFRGKWKIVQFCSSLG